MKNFLKVFLFMVLLFNGAFAASVDSLISDSGFELKSVVALYVFDNENSKVLYKKNENKLLNPASTIKTLTFGASYLTLGPDYEFETAVYKDSKNNLYIKLGADPLLTQGNLSCLLRDVKEKIDISSVNNIFIDDSIIDKTSYPETWMQEDVWPHQREISPYIIDKNYVNISITRSSLATKADIIQNDDYKIPIINELKLGNVQDYKILRKFDDNSNIITFTGTISKDETLKLPVLDSKINFIIKLNNALTKCDFKYFKKVQFAHIPANAVKIASFSHSIDEVSKNILFNSDNFTSEVVAKVAASKYINGAHPATNEDFIKLFYDVYADFVNENIILKDASGVSRSNLASVDFIVKAFNYINSKTDIEKLMASPTEGTLCNRLTFLKNNLKAKTGTLSRMSSIVGVLNTQNGTNSTFAIIIQNSPKRCAVLKHLEDNIITLIYRKY